MRLFIGIRFDDPFRDQLVRLQELLQDCGLSGSYTAADNLHITLAFIGEYGDPGHISDLIEEIGFEPFDIRLKGIGNFGDLYWAGIEKQPELEKLAKRVRRILAENAVPFDRKQFRPHVTLVRNAVFESSFCLPEDMPEASMTVTGITLYRSDRAKKGMTYTVLADTSEG